MRIPLDYYRILGLPIQAPAEQLKQAHHDRTLQLPRREYSEAAVEARRALLDEGYAVLSEPAQRQAYDARFLTPAYDPDLGLAVEEMGDGTATPRSESSSETYTPHIDIAEKHLIGALLILQELGEYELVLKVGRPYLSSGNASLKTGQFGDPKVALADIVLTIALACLELGREQWQQGQYETAAEALETGQELLLRENLFAGVRGEIQSDLLRLRPYRILELLARPNENHLDRKKGITLLQDMLRERNGIDGNGDDQSGLSIDDFLRFVQQLRDYLTAEEQQVLFEEEAKRPSAVATYLAVYALLARGFAEHQPALIRRAKHMLMKLGGRQDVHLEQAVCALLLGQTEEASRVLELSQEHEPLAFIREQSQGAPDLLPGLCLYAERWLQEEVFPHFRDLVTRRVSLKDYFADGQVQAYLEELPTEGETLNAPMWNAKAPSTTTVGSGVMSAPSSSRSQPLPNARLQSPPSHNSNDRHQQNGTGPVPTTAMPPSAITPATMTPARSSSDIEEEALTNSSGLTIAGATAAGAGMVMARGSAESAGPAYSEGGSIPPGSRAPRAKRETPGGMEGIPPRRMGKPKPRKKRFPAWLPWAIGLVGVGLLGFLVSRLSRQTVQAPPAPTPSISIAVSPSPTATSVQGDLTPETAKQLLELWFTAKRAAMGPGYAADQLSLVLVDPKLSEWQRESAAAQRDAAHVEYEHAVQVENVEMNPSDPNTAIVTANVREFRKYYQNNQLAESQTDDLRLKYTMVRQDNQWRIANWQ
ncbi:IMS domain-containing protein [Alkalinema pantanalense CENA528]|uniref:IMS domain-containing protein n=1 Tax=Alkalinema pantanalense TaxID=1620705 RepID=UPI003D6DD0BB